MTLTEDRLERERAFHNERFGHEERRAQSKYYVALRDGMTEFGARLRELARGADLLEYGCGDTRSGLELAAIARSVQGIDISDVAIEASRADAAAAGVANVRYDVANAEAMEFADGSFDLVFGSGIIHHLDIEKSFSEVRRVLRPSGRALFWEPLGHNVIVNGYRALTPGARTPDEHPLLKRDFDTAQRHFGEVSTRFYGLTSLAAVPFAASPMGDTMIKLTSGLDRALFRIPGMRWQAWYAMIELSQPRQPQ